MRSGAAVRFIETDGLLVHPHRLAGAGPIRRHNLFVAALLLREEQIIGCRERRPSGSDGSPPDLRWRRAAQSVWIWTPRTTLFRPPPRNPAHFTSSSPCCRAAATAAGRRDGNAVSGSRRNRRRRWRCGRRVRGGCGHVLDLRQQAFLGGWRPSPCEPRDSTEDAVRAHHREQSASGHDDSGKSHITRRGSQAACDNGPGHQRERQPRDREDERHHSTHQSAADRRVNDEEAHVPAAIRNASTRCARSSGRG